MRIGGAAGPVLGAAVLALIGSYRPVMAAAAVGFLASVSSAPALRLWRVAHDPKTGPDRRVAADHD
jgi:hypothetical protein